MKFRLLVERATLAHIEWRTVELRASEPEYASQLDITHATGWMATRIAIHNVRVYVFIFWTTPKRRALKKIMCIQNHAISY